MGVVSSSFALDPVIQADGSRWCLETHVCTTGNKEYYYLLAPGGDANAIMTARVASVNALLADEEEQANIDRDGAPTLNEMTAAQFATRLRTRFRSASNADACKLAYWLLRRIAAGQITDNQCANAFGVTLSQWTTFKTNQLQPRSDAWTTVLAAAGA